MSHVTYEFNYMNESYIWMSHVTDVILHAFDDGCTWLIHMWHDSFICDVARIWWLVATLSYVMLHAYDDVATLSYVLLRVVLLLANSRTSDMTHSQVWHDSFLCVTWLIHMCDVLLQAMLLPPTNACVLAVCCSVCVAVIIHMCDMLLQVMLLPPTKSHLWHDTKKPCRNFNTLQHTTPHCNTPKHMRHDTKEPCHKCNTLQHTATWLFR